MRNGATDGEGAHASHLSPVPAPADSGRKAVLLSPELWEIVLEELDSSELEGIPMEVLVAIQSRYAGGVQESGQPQSLVVYARRAEDGGDLLKSIKVSLAVRLL